MFTKWETDAIQIAIHKREPEKYIDQWHLRMKENKLYFSKEEVLKGLHLLQAIRLTNPSESPNEIFKKADQYSLAASIHDVSKTQEMIKDFSAVELLQEKSKEIDPTVFSLREASDLFLDAVSENNVEGGKLYLEGGVDIHVRQDRALALSVNYALKNSLYHESPDQWQYSDALKHFHTPPECEMMKLLLEHGADPDARNGEIFFEVIQEQNHPVAMILLEAGADATQSSNLALYLAQKNSDYKMMDLLVKYGADKNLLKDYEINKINSLKKVIPDNIKPPGIKGNVGRSPLDKAIATRKELSNYILENLKKEGKILPSSWDKTAMRPHNPVSGAYYTGKNRLWLMYQAAEKGYRDPRWCTFDHASSKGWQIKKGEKGTLCEKYIWEKKVVVTKEDGTPLLDENGNPKMKSVKLEKPYINTFILFNGDQIKGIPEYKPTPLSRDESLNLADSFIHSSQCEIKEVAQDQAYYDPSSDTIVLPLRESFLSTEDFLRTALHEMAHSTGHSSRLDRPMMNFFGTPDYAREELNAELGAIFTKFDLGIEFDTNGYIEERHRQYIKSWISILEEEPAEFFRATTRASQISRYLTENFEHYQELYISTNQIQNAESDDYLEKLNTDFKKNNFSTNQTILNNIKKLNETTGHKHLLIDVNAKFHNLKFLSPDEREIVQELGKELQQQELNRKQAMTQITIAPEPS